jgi:hypothetical protein
MTPQKLPRHDWLIPEFTLDLVRQAADQYRQVLVLYQKRPQMRN